MPGSWPPGDEWTSPSPARRNLTSSQGPPRDQPMKLPLTGAERESPARRLETLYVLSVIAVAILSAISHGLILGELTRQSETLKSISRVSRQPSINHSLGLAALQIQAAGESKVTTEQLDALRKALKE